MPNVITADVYLEVNSVPLATPAWRVTDWFPLMDDAPVRGDNRRISGVAGRRPYPRVRDERRVTLPLTIFGHRTRENVAIADPRMGLISNREYLAANLGIASSVGDGTVAAIWHRYDGSTKTANVHVLGLFGFTRHSPATAVTTLDLIIPAGVFA